MAWLSDAMRAGVTHSCNTGTTECDKNSQQKHKRNHSRRSHDNVGKELVWVSQLMNRNVKSSEQSDERRQGKQRSNIELYSFGWALPNAKPCSDKQANEQRHVDDQDTRMKGGYGGVINRPPTVSSNVARERRRIRYPWPRRKWIDG